MLTILLGLVIFLATKLIPEKFKESPQAEKIDPDSESQPEQAQKKEETPENLAQWVLKMEKAKTELKEKLCVAPVSTDSKNLFGRDEVLIEVFNAIHKGISLIELHGRSGVGKTALALEIVFVFSYHFQRQSRFSYARSAVQCNKWTSFVDSVEQFDENFIAAE